MLPALMLGAAYGITAGVSPGPTLGLTIAQTLRRGLLAGTLVALAPLATDLPIILLAYFVLGSVPNAVLGWLGIAGGAFVIYLGIETLRTLPHDGSDILKVQEPAAWSRRGVLARAIATNALNPHPYLFWIAVGGQLLVRNVDDHGMAGAIGFLTGFYALLVGCKVLIALAVDRSRRWLGSRGYRLLLAGSGLLLVGLGFFLASDGVRTLL